MLNLNEGRREDDKAGAWLTNALLLSVTRPAP